MFEVIYVIGSGMHGGRELTFPTFEEAKQHILSTIGSDARLFIMQTDPEGKWEDRRVSPVWELSSSGSAIALSEKEALQWYTDEELCEIREEDTPVSEARLIYHRQEVAAWNMLRGKNVNEMFDSIAKAFRDDFLRVTKQ